MPNTNIRPPRVALIGHGYWGKNIARNLNDLGALFGVYDPREETRKTVAALYPEASLFPSFKEVLADPTIDAVAISAPAEYHAELSIQAMSAGKHVFVEKPLALKYQDGVKMVDASQRYNQILMVGHLLLYHPGVLELVRMVEDGQLGDLQYIYSNRLNLGKFRREENILWSFAPHDISVILRLAGGMPIQLRATGGTYLQANVADTTITQMLFENGMQAHIFVSWLHPFKEQKLVVIGSKKMAVFDDGARCENKLMVMDAGADWSENMPIPRKDEGEPVSFDAAEPLKEEIKHFLDCIRVGKQPRTDGKNGLDVLEVLQAAQRSIQTGGERVPLLNHQEHPESILSQ